MILPFLLSISFLVECVLGGRRWVLTKSRQVLQVDEPIDT